MQHKVSEAILSINKESQFIVKSNAEIIWLDKKINQPSINEIEEKMNELDVLKKEETKLLKIQNHIYSKYPLEKQTQDEKWVSSYSTKLKALEVKDLELTIVRMAEDMYAGKTLEEVLQNVPQEQKKMYEKLVKVAVRTQWMEDCIEEGRLAMEQNREPNFDAIIYLNV